MTIKAGDLVQVVRAHCDAGSEWLGHTFIVERIGYKDIMTCNGCGAELNSVTYAVRDGHLGGYGVSYLKKIPPLSDLEGQKDSSGLDERHEFYEALRKMAEGLRS